MYIFYLPITIISIYLKEIVILSTNYNKKGLYDNTSTKIYTNISIYSCTIWIVVTLPDVIQSVVDSLHKIVDNRECTGPAN
jgi:hypothetical protein